MTTTLAMGDADDYLDELWTELTLVGIRGALRARILAEAADHLVEGEVEEFGEPRLIAQRFADELATVQSRGAALRAFAALAVAGVAFGAAWLLVPAAGGWTDITAIDPWPLYVAAAIGMLVCSQVAFAASLLALLRAVRLRGAAAAPAAEVRLLLTRTRTALGFGAGAMLSLACFAVLSRGELAGWWVLAVAPAALAATILLAVVARTAARAAQLRPALPGPAGDVFDDLPAGLPRRPWALCFVVAALAGAAALLGGGSDEGPRNAVAESLLVVACFAALGRRLGLRR